MTNYPERRRARSAGWARRFAVFALVLLATDWIGHHYGLVETVAYLWVLAIVALLAAIALLFAGLAFSRLWKFGDLGERDIIVGVLVSIVVLSPYAFAAYRMLAYPQLRDVSTDPDDPPALDTSDRLPGMNVLSSPSPGEIKLQTENYPLVTGHRYDLPLDETLAVVEAVIKTERWEVRGQLPPADDSSSPITINALAFSTGLELPVDVAVRIAADGDSTLVDMRSASRYGRHDLGDNAERIMSFLTALDDQVTGQTGSGAVTAK